MGLDRRKTDGELGLRISEYLKKKGVETPVKENYLTESEKLKTIEDSFRVVMETLGLDLSDDSLMDTPKRVASMYVNEIYWGLKPENFPKVSAIENKMGYHSMVVERNVNVQSNCEHHFIVIDGEACVAYVPNNKVLGLSKINRIVEYFSKRPQVQERLTEQIYYALEYILETPDIAVIIDARHYCVKARGVEDEGSETITSKFGGRFNNDVNLRNEFFTMVKR